jgi:F-type H+-transporting ATPase subunit delta
MKNLRAARRYAVALMDEVKEGPEFDAVANDLALIGSMLQGSRELRLLLASPVISEQKKLGVFDALLGTRVSEATMTFVRLLISKQRGTILPEIIEQFVLLRDAKLGIVQVDVQSAVGITASQQRTLQDRLDRYTRKKAQLRLAVMPELRGGLLVRIGDTVLDATVRRQLEMLRERFTTGHVVEDTDEPSAARS